MIAVLTSTVSAAPRTASALSFVSCTTPRAVCAQPVAPASTSTHATDHKAFMIPPRYRSERPGPPRRGICVVGGPIIPVSPDFGARYVPVKRPTLALPDDIEEHRDQCWRREEKGKTKTPIKLNALIKKKELPPNITNQNRLVQRINMAFSGRGDTKKTRKFKK